MRDSITIIGCGGIGSWLAYSLSLFKNSSFFDTLILIDNDCIEEKNLPYLHVIDPISMEVGMPKVVVLTKYLSMINRKLNIIQFENTYPFESPYLLNSFLIDCRDTPNIVENTNLKVSLSGKYGIVHFNPSVNNNNIKNARYVYGYDVYYAMKFSSWIVDTIFYQDEQKEKRIGINLESKEVQVYEL